MNIYKADLHTHTLFSPCGDLEMTPDNIIAIALERGIDVIAITDHNATRHCRLAEQYSHNRDIFVLCGAEITTKEEAHCLAYMPDHESLDKLQAYLDEHLPDTPNNPDVFGDQVQIDEEFNIVYEEPRLLTSALDQSVNEIADFVHSIGGLFVPAHIDKSTTSLISQLGFIPFDLEYDAVELSKHGNKDEILKVHKYLKNKMFTRSSDAHLPDVIGTATCYLEMETRSFEEIRMALHGENGRKVHLVYPE
ncbi:MAG: PHP domain-containing protein [Bacteroidales bacterium]|nr:PHP domain-containing protein [Bacteroidales bacterium]